jgi:hypothetical protein
MTAHLPRTRRRGALAAVVIGAALLAARPGVAHAKTGPGARWTQQDNGNYPASTSNPNCSPCLKWDNDLYWVTYFNAFTQPTFRKATDAAVSQWSSQPYRSPAFVKDQSKGGNANLVVTANDLSSYGKVCGIEFTSYNSGTRAIFRTRVYLNTRMPFYTDPAVGGCNVTTTLLHEVGHAFAEGHSSLTTDLMYKAAKTSNQSIDADAKAMLAAVYGPLPRSGGCNAVSSLVGSAAKVAMVGRAVSIRLPTADDRSGPSACAQTSAIPATVEAARTFRAPRIPLPDLVKRRIETTLGRELG